MARFENAETHRAQTRFIRKSMSEPLLARDHEFDLARAWRDNKDEAALHELIRSYTRLVVSTATRYRHYGLPISDLVQEGSVGLMQAAARFDPDREIRFSTYASWWIRSAIQDFVLRNWSIVRTGTTAAQKTLFFNFRRLRARIEDESGASFDDKGRNQVATELSVGLHEVESMEQRLSGMDHSLNHVIGEDGESEWQDFLVDERPNPEDLIISYKDGETRSRWITEALSELPLREQRIVKARRLTEESATLEELGRELGVSKERVRQLEGRALSKLKSAMLRRVETSDDLIAEV
ncbi:RNA polymerase factor sigma-32 [Denitrobaculum tricleocarpae]|uniref:RNA polymerase sigma factor n=1 Tax=Denitrobaculum tricleocarpae TaxID=2591009 RepID=A0A545TQY9_9PROT|nr:RNA polymerase factor sigma-32 [Denitrobaculum tricleocarpae]TQV79637.1 RNA polymerase factor sigma-32 [Denitrobaculum tricleocarpae]